MTTITIMVSSAWLFQIIAIVVSAYGVFGFEEKFQGNCVGREQVLPFGDLAVFNEIEINEIVNSSDIDWVKQGAVTPVISQGRCGTCAQFSAVGDIEAQWFLSGKPLVALSVQEMIDCSSYTGPYGMGWVANKGGLSRATDYPLANHSDPTILGCRSPCKTVQEKPFASISGASCLPSSAHDDEDQILAYLQKGPLSVSIAAGALNGYKGGIINGSTCNTTSVDHAVLLVGAGTANGMPYWKIKNSWGKEFGEEGYFRMQRGYSKIQQGLNCLGLRGVCQATI